MYLLAVTAIIFNTNYWFKICIASEGKSMQKTCENVPFLLYLLHKIVCTICSFRQIEFLTNKINFNAFKSVLIIFFGEGWGHTNVHVFFCKLLQNFLDKLNLFLLFIYIYIYINNRTIWGDVFFHERLAHVSKLKSIVLLCQIITFHEY